MFSGPKPLTVIMGDLVDSRRLRHRAQFSRTIQSVIGRFAREFQEEFHAPFVLTRGIDELSGVLKRSRLSYRFCRLINDALEGPLFRFAIVRGVLDVGVASRNPNRMDGPAFHRAADLITIAKQENRYYCFHLGLPGEDFDRWFNELAALVHVVRSGWTTHQRRVVETYERLETQEAVAKKLSITQQAVSDALRQASWKEVARADALINSALAQPGSKPHAGRAGGG
jgi:hypothetical protein